MLHARIWKKKGFLIGGAVTLLLAVFAVSTARVHVTGHYEGVYLLKGETSCFELTDDVLLGEEDKVVAGVSWETMFQRLGVRHAHADGEPSLEYEWFANDGSGFVRSVTPDGKELLTCFSRFRDSLGRVPQGLFLGGGLPYHEHGDDAVSMNDTGMAYFDGQRWYHLWCNVNEAVSPGGSPSQVVYPSQWEFLGSRVIEADAKRVILKSSHRVTLDGMPLQIDRYVLFRAGEPYFILINRMRNTGTSPGSLVYGYGDEPWVGNYGSSGGNVGWSKDRLFPYEGEIDTRKYTFAGFYDCGNREAGDRGAFTGKANFIEWLGPPPDVAYFSNDFGDNAPESARVPLKSYNNRVISMHWGPQLLHPGQSVTYALAIGMAGSDPRSGLPVKPEVAFGYREAQAILSR